MDIHAFRINKGRGHARTRAGNNQALLLFNIRWCARVIPYIYKLSYYYIFARLTLTPTYYSYFIVYDTNE